MSDISPLPPERAAAYPDLERTLDALLDCLVSRPADLKVQEARGASAPYCADLAGRLREAGDALRAAKLLWGPTDKWEPSPDEKYGAHARRLLQFARDPTPANVAAVLRDLRWGPALLDEVRLCVSAWARTRLVKERPPGHTPPPAPVLRLVVAEKSVYLDGQPVRLNLTAEAADETLTYLRAVIQAAPNWVTGPDIGCGIRWDRVRRRLPACLRDLIETDRRKGNRLHSRAWRR